MMTMTAVNLSNIDWTNNMKFISTHHVNYGKSSEKYFDN